MPPERKRDPIQDDGTTQLLSGGGLILAVGVVSFGLLMTVLGGVSVEGAHSNPGWLALIVAAMCLPFGLLLTLLGFAKWLRKRSHIRKN
jgi:NhaP-type Na+/H+ or K+/H+ antiporter